MQVTVQWLDSDEQKAERRENGRGLPIEKQKSSSNVPTFGIQTPSGQGFWQLLTGNVAGNRFVQFSIAYGVLFASHITIQVTDMFWRGYDFAVFTEKLSVNLTCVESVIKMSFYCFKRHSLLEILALFKNDLLLSTSHPTEKACEILKANAVIVNKATKGFIFMIFTTICIWNSLPLLKCFTSAGCTSLQIMPSWYPADVTSFPFNALVYMFEFSIMVYCAALLYNVNCIFSALALTASAQFELLSTNMSHIETNSKKIVAGNPILGKQDVMYQLLRDCLIDHQTLLRLLQRMEDVFNPIFLFQMLTSTFTICLVLVQLNVHLASSNELPLAMACKFLMYLIFGSVELLVYSWGGQIIYNKSEKIYWSLQKCGWHEGSRRFKTSLQIALIRSKFPVSLTAGKFYAVDLASFTKVMKASYSYFTFLHESDSFTSKM